MIDFDSMENSACAQNVEIVLIGCAIHAWGVREGKNRGGGDNNFPDLDGNCPTDTKLFSVIFLSRGLYTSYMLPSHHFYNLK
jgi:hypothetical protein